MATSKETPAWEVLYAYDCGDSFKRFMKLEKIVPALVNKKLLKKKLGKHILKQQDKDLLLSTTQKEWGPDQFITYLEVLMELCHGEGSEGNTLKLMQIMKGSLEAMRPEPSSKLERTIQQFKEVIDTESCLQSVRSLVESSQQTTTTSEQQTLPIQLLSADAPMKPPAGQFGDTVSCRFTTNEGCVLYSPIHGVTVTIPPKAFPGSVCMTLSMHFYLGHPFTLKEGVQSCSVIVWFHLNQHLELLEDVTVEIPHAARTDSTHLCVLTWGKDNEGPPYKLDTEVPADFSDGYHAVFKVKHFSPYGIVLKKMVLSLPKIRVGHTGKKLKDQTSSDLEHSLSDLCTVVTSGVSYTIVCYMPQDRSSQWEVTFAACYNHPSGNWVLQLVKKQLYGSAWCIADRLSFFTRDDYVKLDPIAWKDKCGSGFALKTSFLSIQDIKSVPRDTPQKNFEELISTKLYPPSVTYSVQCSVLPSNRALKKIYVAGATVTEHSRQVPFFVLTSSPTPTLQFNYQAGQLLYTTSYLYGERGHFINSKVDTVLNPNAPDHVKFLAEISFQVPNSTILSQALNLSRTVLDQIMYECQQVWDICFSSYKLLTEWVTKNGEEAKLSCLKTALFATGIRGIEVQSTPEYSSKLISPFFDDYPFPNICSSEAVSTVGNEVKFALKLGRKLRCCWRMVGSLMGIPLIQLTELQEVAAYDVSANPGYDMLLSWQKRHGRDAKLGTVFKALECMHCHRSSHVNDAHWYATSIAEKLYSESQAVR